MADHLQEKVRKLLEIRSKAETEKYNLLRNVNNAVKNEDRYLLIDQLVTLCDQAMKKLYLKHAQLFELPSRTEDLLPVKQDLETWLGDVTTQNAILKEARDYIDHSSKTDASTKNDFRKEKASKQNINFKT